MIIKYRKHDGGESYRLGHYEISIHKYAGCGDSLFLSCNRLGLTQVRLVTTSIKEARITACKKVYEHLADLSNAYKDLIKEMGNNDN